MAHDQLDLFGEGKAEIKSCPPPAAPAAETARPSSTPAKANSYNPYPYVRRQRPTSDERSNREISKEAADAVAAFLRNKGVIVKCPASPAFGAYEPKNILSF